MRYTVDTKGEGTERFIIENSSGEFELAYDDPSAEELEIFHETEMMRLAIQNGRATVDEGSMTATLVVKVPVKAI